MSEQAKKAAKDKRRKELLEEMNIPTKLKPKKDELIRKSKPKKEKRKKEAIDKLREDKEREDLDLDEDGMFKMAKPIFHA